MDLNEIIKGLRKSIKDSMMLRTAVSMIPKKNVLSAIENFSHESEQNKDGYLLIPNNGDFVLIKIDLESLEQVQNKDDMEPISIGRVIKEVI